jgi:Domain of unknown function (DUF4062)
MVGTSPMRYAALKSLGIARHRESGAHRLLQCQGSSGRGGRMPFNARVFQVFIASPGDVQEEREIATEVIRRWNDLNAREKSLVLLPLRWETHSTPELGTRPQGVINRQVLEHCDMVVGIFWTRLGTPTGESASGTVEEIERAGTNGKPVMLYFSNSKVDLDTVDLDEYKRLKEFKNKMYPEGLIDSYSSPTEFREKFSRQLSMKIPDLITHDHKDEIKGANDEQPDISLALLPDSPLDFLRSSSDYRENVGFEIQSVLKSGRLQIEVISCDNQNKNPDFRNYSDTESQVISLKYKQELEGLILPSRTNSNYYRKLVEFYIMHKQYISCRVAIINNAAIGYPNVAFQIKLDNTHGHLRIASSLPQRPQKESFSALVRTTTSVPYHNFLQIKNAEDHWDIVMDMNVVQAKRTIVSANQFFLGAAVSCPIQLETTIYSTVSPPFVLLNTFDIEVLERSMTYQEILEELGEKIEE